MSIKQLCYCSSGRTFEDCCEPLVLLKRNASSAEELMRSRYTAYVFSNANYLINTTHPKMRPYQSKKAILQWAKENEWVRLEVVLVEQNRVVFKAYCKNSDGVTQVYEEDSLFEMLGGKWYYVSGT